MRSFVTAIVVLILGIACLGIAAFRGMATRFLIAGIVPLAWSVIDFFFAFTQSSIDSQAEKVTDERDRYIAMKSSRKVLLIANYVIGAGEFQRQQMVFRVVGVWPLIHESEAREQIHAWLVARIHLSQHERRAIGTPRIITKPHNHRGEQRVSEMLPRTFSAVAMYEIW